MFTQTELSFGARFGLWAASLVMGFLLFLSIISTAMIANVRIVTSEDGIYGIVRTIMSAPAQVRPKAPAIASGEGGLRIAPRVNRTYQMPHREEPGNVASSLTDQLIGMFYEEMGDQLNDALPVTQEEFTQLINESTVKDYIAEKTASLITDYFNDEITTTFEPEEIVQLIQENSALIETIAGQPIPDDIAQQIATIFVENEIIVIVEEEGLAGFMKLANGENPEGSLGDSGDNSDSSFDLRAILNTVQEATSVGNLILGIFISLVLMAGIILSNCHQIGKGLRRAGYPLMLAGSSIILNILAKSNPDMWIVDGNQADSQVINLALKLVRHVLLETAVINIVIFSLGLVLVIGGIVLPIVLKAQSKPEAAEESSAPTAE